MPGMPTLPLHPRRSLGRFGVILGMLSVVSVEARAQHQVTSGKVREGALSYDGKATLGDFTGTTTVVQGEMTGSPDLASVRGWVEASVKTMVTGNGRRDRDMYKTMDVDQFPTMRYDLTSLVPGRTHGDSVEVTLQGSFTIHGISKAAAIPAVVTFAAGSVRVRGEVPINVKDYGVTRLTRFLGTLRFQENIVIHIDVTFIPGAGTGGQD